VKCGLATVSDREWKDTCFPCWKKGKDYPPTTGDGAFVLLQEAYKDLERQLTQAQRGRVPPATLDPCTLKDLLLLCHPDKHGGSERANRVAKWLNGQRA
jgi:hypothetical protein